MPIRVVRDKNPKIVLFYKASCPFSNFYPAKFSVEIRKKQVEFNCSEQYFMHHKALLAKDQIGAKQIMKMTKPLLMKRAGRKLVMSKRQLEELQNDATVKVDGKQRITEYTADDGSFKLKGFHNVAAKNKAKLAEKLRQRLSSDTSEDEDEVRDDDDDEEDSEEELEKEDDKKNNTITRGGRMSNNRYRTGADLETSNQSETDNPIDEIVNTEESETSEITCYSPFAPASTSDSHSDIHYNRLARNKLSCLISSEEFLNVLLTLVICLKSHVLTELRKKIEKAIEKLEDEDEEVPRNYLLMALDSGLYLVTKSASLAQSQEDSTSLKELLMCLRGLIYFNRRFTFSHPSFDDFLQELGVTIGELIKQDKKVPIEKIRSALWHILDIVIT